MLGAIREVQIPLLAAMLLCGCGAKAFRVLRARQIGVGLGPTALFPMRLRRPVAVCMCVAELGLGTALVLTARRGAGLSATLSRAGTTVLFLIAVGALVELRERRPGAGCGCFGDLSAAPVGARTIARSVLLAVAAMATIGLAPLRMPTSGSAAWLRIGLLCAEILLIAALSPEIGEALVRLGYSEPCEVRRISVERTLAALAGSAPWRRHAGLVTSAVPADIWREGCWRYVLYAGHADGHRADVVFAVSLRSRRPQIRAAVLDAVTGEVHTDLPARPRAAQDPPDAQRPAGEPARYRELPELDATRPLPVRQRPRDTTHPLEVTQPRGRGPATARAGRPAG